MSPQRDYILIWVSVPHLEFLSFRQAEALPHSVAGHQPDALLICGGTIAQAINLNPTGISPRIADT